jgi:uncharacterized protein YegJ (DUF2314 family)
MKSCIILALLLLSDAAFSEEKIQDKSVLVKDEDYEMNLAIEKAKATLNEFLILSKNPPKGASGFKVKVMIEDENGIEHMWVQPFSHTGDEFIGIIANEPDYVKNVRFGQKYKFGKKDITDWGYVLDGKQKGSFTVCVVFKHLPEAEVKKYKDDYGFECVP